MDHAVGTNVSIWSSILNGGATSLPYLQKLNLINVDDTTGEITLASGVTYEHTSDIYALDAEGVYRKFGEDVPIVSGGRVVKNHCTNTDFSTAVTNWALPTGPSTPGHSDPFGGTRAGRCTVTARYGGIRQNIELSPTFDARVCNSIWLRSVSGGTTLNIHTSTGAAGFRREITITSEWQRFTITRDMLVSDGIRTLLVEYREATDFPVFDFYLPQYELFTYGTTDSIPSEALGPSATALTKTFATEKANTVDANGVVTEAKGADISPPPQLVYQPALTNSALYSNDQTNAWWTKSNCTAVKDEVGIAGVANNACTITATGANATVLGTAITAASATHATAWHIKRKTGAGTIQLTLDGGTTWQTVTLTTSYQRLAADQSAVTNPRIGVRIVTSGDAIIVGHAGLHLTKTKEAVENAGPITTTAVAVATDRTVIQPPLTAHDNDAGLWYLDAEWSMPETATAQGVISVDGAAEGSVLAYTAASGFVASDDGVTTSAIAASNFVMPGSLKHCIVYSQADNKMRLFMGGSLAGTEVAFDGFNLGTVVDLLLSCGYPVKINAVKSYSIASYADGIALKDELLA